MKVKQTILALIVALSAGLILFGGQVVAAQNSCGGADTSIIGCDANDDTGDWQDSGLWALLKIVINIMTAGVGVLAVAGIIYGAVLYTSAGGSQEQVKKAIDIIRNVVIGLVAFALMWALLNFLIPGGLLI